ncbi:MAG TPA: tetratricopeptide repeat-containing diguanylate cyclase [Herpetosiphonaceae bacterium]|nr:tetratricopeptide repeat-containing diguanylate cyclase [Herpetosiphonaceae bacterium]
MSDLIHRLESLLETCADPAHYIDVVNALAANLRHSDLDRAWELSREAERRAQTESFAQRPYYQGLADCFYWRGKLHAIHKSHQQALHCYYQALDYCERAALHPAPAQSGRPPIGYADAPDQFVDQPIDLTALHNILGVTLAHLAQFDEALNHYMQAWQGSEASDNRWMRLLLCNNLGYLYRELNNPAEASTYLAEGLQMIEAFPPTMARQRVKATLLDNCSWAASQLDAHADALRYGGESLAIYRSIQWLQGQAEILCCLGSIYERMGDAAQALECFEQAMAIALEIGLDEDFVGALINSGVALDALGRPAQAIERLERALAQAESAENRPQQAQAHQALADLYERAGEFATALRHYKRYQAIKELLFNEKSDQRMKVLEVIHHLEQARNEARLYQRHTQLLAAEIEERRHAQAELERLATTDPLTGLYNRRQFFYLAQQEFQQAQRFGRPLAAILFDIDSFKLVNDTYGHATGDQVICNVARLALSSLRQVDILGRYGGEEFVILLVETSAEAAEVIATRLRLVIAEDDQDGPARLPGVTISAGVAEMDRLRPDTLDQLLQRADKALYVAKEAGRNQIRRFQPEPIPAA